MDQIARQWIDSAVMASPVAKSMGMTLVAAEADSVVLALPFADHLTTTPGTLHGGVVAALVDTAGAAASASGLTAGDEATGGATSNLSVTYLAPARTGLRATATVVHRARSSTHTQVAVRDADGRLVASGYVDSRIFH
ncbi:PaaI family thioesterase [Streptomyces sp. NPDC059785]|uniref:PaaI family thioesterase n=1 Tax=unclassified Streptomyces TaxID=2593676 RepID=UPI003667A123